ncbi:MAG TPA: methyltransferase, partial [Firmicutes bacterium]|nr:methyltransferase [Bacillota bacterium]
ELDEFLEKYPEDIDSPVYQYGIGDRCQGIPNQVGSYIDAWGCTWHVGEPGVIGEVKNSPLASWDALNHYQLPWELLNRADLSKVNPSCEQSDKFMLASTETRPFERMQFLRGTENLLVDLAYGEREVYQLRDMLHDFSTKEMEIWANTAVDGVWFMDDWGSQRALLISPALWREFYKPLYRDYCDILHRKGKYAFFHSDGNISAIYPDLIEVGIDAVNSQLFCMDMETLGARYVGKITFWGEIDRQKVLPFGSTEDVKQAVQRVSKALIPTKKTGVIAQCEWGVKDPKQNIEAVFETWNTI